MKSNELDSLCVNALRMLSVDMVEKAGSGHPGMPMGAAAMAYVLYTEFLRHNPCNPEWINRDRFVLSAGHGSALLYSILHLTGYGVDLNELKNFRQWGSSTPGHPEYGVTPGVECTTGPLGQGFATGVGMALGERVLEGHFNKKGEKIIDYNIFGIVSDGDLMEGLTQEAASLAGSLKLGNIVYLYDSNNISIEGATSLTYCEDVKKKYEAFGWDVLRVQDGNDLRALRDAVGRSVKNKKPSLIIVNTEIGYGSPNKQGTSKAHGEPMGVEEVRLIRERFGWPEKDFYISKQVLSRFRSSVKEGKRMEVEWEKRFSVYKKKCSSLSEELRVVIEGKLPKGWNAEKVKFDGDVATRVASGKVINAIAKNFPLFLGGSADLAPSTKTWIEDGGEVVCGFEGGSARNIHFGVREHAMAAVLNGLALTSGVKPFGGTFLVFSDYMRGAIRVAALSGYCVTYVLTHDSIAVGEDGPTHEPVEHVMSLRAIPGLTVLRPADANETREAWEFAVKNKKGPVALILTRQKLPVIDQGKYSKASNLKYGAYVINPGIKKPDLIIVATGSEVSLALSVAEEMMEGGVQIRVVSMPSWEIFEAQSKRYRESVLPRDVKKRVSIEAGVSLGWERYVGDGGLVVGIDRFGASAPGKVNMDKFGFSSKKIIRKMKNKFKI